MTLNNKLNTKHNDNEKTIDNKLSRSLRNLYAKDPLPNSRHHKLLIFKTSIKNRKTITVIAVTSILLSSIFSTIPEAHSLMFEPAVTITEPIPENNAQLGISVTTGDINNDGKSDLITGAFDGTVGGNANAGEVFMFLGPDLTTVTSITEPVPEIGAEFGKSVATGDINNDGFDDVIVGADQADPGGIAQAGEVFVFLGPDLTTVISLTEPVIENSANFGVSVATSDMNNDNFDDVLVGAHNANPGGILGAGEVFVFLGPTLTTVISLSEPTPETGAGFGFDVTAGDVNNDSNDDVIVGATGADVGGVSAGEVFVFLGPSLTSVTTLTDPTPQNGALFGNAIDSGDVNNDNFDDVIVGAVKGEDAFVFLGPGLTSVTRLTQPIPEPQADFGASVTAGDVNNDGNDDVIVGASEAYGGMGTSPGAAYIFLGPGFTDVTTLSDPIPEDSSQFGGSVSTGDMNNDGNDDVIVGANAADVAGFNNAGEVFYFESIPEVVTCNGLEATIVGTSGADTLDGTSGNDVIVGLEGNDTIDGKGGDDTICGGDGMDIISGSGGSDTIFGDEGDDQIFGNDGTDEIHGGAGIDYIEGGFGADTIFGDDDNDVIFGKAGSDTIDGGSGDDLISGDDGSDTITGGEGNDRIFGAGDGDTISGDAGNDVLLGEGGSDSLDGGTNEPSGVDVCIGGGQAGDTSVNCEVTI